MNILIFSWRCVKHPLAGGAEQVMHNHATSWIARGHQVTLFTSSYPGSPPEETIDGIRIIHRGYELLRVQFEAVRWYLFHRKTPFDLVIDEFHGLPFFTPLFVNQPKLAVVQEVTKQLWFLNHLGFPFNYLLGIVGFLIEPFIFLLYRQVPFMVGSNSAKQDLLSFGIPALNINVITHGINTPANPTGPAKAKLPTLIFLAPLARDKGIEDALDILALVNASLPVQLLVVGKGTAGDYYDHLKRKVTRLGLSEQVRFMGFVPETEKFALLAQSHLLIHTSAREGWGLTVIEASWAGTPTVGYRVAGLVDSIVPGVNGQLVPFKDKPGMAQTILHLLNTPSQLAALSKSAQVHAQTFNWTKSYALSSQLLKKILAPRILILNWKDIKHPAVGGAEIIVYELAKRLVSSGYRVDWFCRSFPSGAADEEVDGIHIIRRGNLITTYLYAPLHYWSSPKPNLVLDMSNTVCWQAPLWATKSKVIAYLNQLAQEVFFYEYPPLVSHFGWLFERLQYLFYRHTPFLCYSNSTKTDLVSMGIPQPNIHLFPIGLDLVRYHPGSKSLTPLFICVSRLVKMKRTDLVIRAMDLVHRKYPQARLVIIGTGYQQPELTRLRDQLNLGHTVLFADRDTWFFQASPKDLKISFMQQAWALVTPSIKEGWCMTVTECAACGTPAIVTNVSGLRDSVIPDKTGLVLPAHPQPAQLADVMTRLIENRPLRLRLSANALSWAQHFSWEKSYLEFSKIISSL